MSFQPLANRVVTVLAAMLITVAGVAEAGTTTAGFSTVLSMDPNEACGASICSDGASIDQNYGDAAGVDITWGTATNIMTYWSMDYSDLTDVVYAESDSTSVGQIDIAALAGSTITLNGFDLGAWDDSRDSQWQIEDLNGTVLAASGSIVIDSALRTSIVAGFSSTNGFRIIWGPDGFNVGLDNLDFVVDAAVVPLPAAAWLFISALGGLVVAKRKKA